MQTARYRFELPTCFSQVRDRLQVKFAALGPESINDSIQYASIEYWLQDIKKDIPDDTEAFRWFFLVASRYLLKEVKRSKRYCQLSEAAQEELPQQIEDKVIYEDALHRLEEQFSERNASMLIRHAMGYTLKEIAISEHITLDAAKRRHARLRKTIRQKRKSV